jgi:hypothetical protein
MLLLLLLSVSHGAPLPQVSLCCATSGVTGTGRSFDIGLNNAATDPGYYPFVDIVFPGYFLDSTISNQIHPRDEVELRVRSSAFPSDSPINFMQIPYTETCQDNSHVNPNENVNHHITTTSDGNTTTHQTTTTTSTTTTTTSCWFEEQTCVNHPWVATEQVCGTPGDILVTVTFQATSLVAGRPTEYRRFSGTLTFDADVGEYMDPLSIRARGGFFWGADPDDNPDADPPIWSHSGDTTTWPSVSFTPLPPIIVTVSRHGGGTALMGSSYYDSVYIDFTTDPTEYYVSNIVITSTMSAASVWVGYETSYTTDGYRVDATPASTTLPQNSPNNVATISYLNGVNGHPDIRVSPRYTFSTTDADGSPTLDAQTNAPRAYYTNHLVECDIFDVEADAWFSDSWSLSTGFTLYSTYSYTSFSVYRSVENRYGVNITKPGSIFAGRAQIFVGPDTEYWVTFRGGIPTGMSFYGDIAPVLNDAGTEYTLGASSYDVEVSSSGSTTVTFHVSDTIGSTVRGSRNNLYVDFYCKLEEYYASGANVEMRNYLTLSSYADAQVYYQGSATGHTLTRSSSRSYWLPSPTLTGYFSAVNGVACAGSQCSSALIVTPTDVITITIEISLPFSDYTSFAMQVYLQELLMDVTSLQILSAVTNDNGFPSVDQVTCCGPESLVTDVPDMTTDAVTNSFSIEWGAFDDPSSRTSTITFMASLELLTSPFEDLRSFVTPIYGSSQGQNLEYRPAFVCGQPILYVTNVVPTVLFKDGIQIDNPDFSEDSLDAGDILRIEVTLDNIGHSTAFDVTVTCVMNYFTTPVVSPFDDVETSLPLTSFDSQTLTFTFTELEFVDSRMVIEYNRQLEDSVPSTAALSYTCYVSSYSSAPGAANHVDELADVYGTGYTSGDIYVNIDPSVFTVTVTPSITPLQHQPARLHNGDYITVLFAMELPQGTTSGVILDVQCRWLILDTAEITAIVGGMTSANNLNVGDAPQTLTMQTNYYRDLHARFDFGEVLLPGISDPHATIDIEITGWVSGDSPNLNNNVMYCDADLYAGGSIVHTVDTDWTVLEPSMTLTARSIPATGHFGLFPLSSVERVFTSLTLDIETHNARVAGACSSGN